MKLSGFWICCISILVLLFCSGFVLADELYPTVTYVFFEKDGLPIHEPITFTVNCYGITCERWDCKGPQDNGDPAQFSTNLAYSYHASCPDYGCSIYEPYYHAERLKIDHCDVEGKAGKDLFIIQNFSKSPIPACTDLHQFMRGGGRNGGYYNGTPEYDGCVAETRSHRDRCNQYLVSCEPGNDIECENWIVDGKNVKKTPAYSACTDTVDREMRDCDRFLEKIDPSTMIMWKFENSEEPAMRACELRFAIPSGTIPSVQDQQTPNMTYGSPEIATAHDISPVDRLYCSIMYLFGAPC